MYDFVSLLEEQNIRLAPLGTARLNPRKVPADDDLAPSSPPPASLSPGPHLPPTPLHVPHPELTLASLAAFGRGSCIATGRVEPSHPPLPTPPVRPLACSLQQASQPSVPFRFGWQSPSSPTSSEGSTTSSSPTPTPIPALLSPQRPLQRQRAYRRLDGSLSPSAQAVPRLRPAHFSPPAPLGREAMVFLQPRVSAPEKLQAGPSGLPAPAQAGRRPLRLEGTVFLEPPVNVREPMVLRTQPHGSLRREAITSLEPPLNAQGRGLQAGLSGHRYKQEGRGCTN